MTDARSEDVVRRLRSVVVGEVSASALRRAEYSSDASNYRVVPQVVVIPRDTADVLAAVDVARSTGTPITARGGGTSVAGNAVGPGIVIDTSRHLDRVLSIDPDARTAVVEPGTVLDALQAAAAPHGLRFGPDPSTHARCTLGGMIGNNACGPHAVAYGRTADNVVALDLVDGTGRRFSAGDDAGGRGTASVPGLEGLVQANVELLRGEFGRFGRQVSGYSLEHLLPENGGNLARALVGTEGTCGLVLEATVALVPIATAQTLVVLAYPDMIAAADDVPAVLAHGPLAVEGIDARLVDVVRRHKGEARVPPLPDGRGWLLVEVGGVDAADAAARAARLAASTGAATTLVVADPREAAGLWRIRDDGAGLAGRTARGRQAWPGWEDAAVPPERLGAYLRDFESLLDAHGIEGLLYGHFGDGCVHVRLDLPLEDQPGRLRPFLVEAAQLVAAHDGSLSGEHGDGRARSELLRYMYSAEAIDVLGSFKALFDPEDLLNPGVVVAPHPVDGDLRRPAATPVILSSRPGGLALAEDEGDLTRAVHRCVGIGKCRADISGAGGFMCPSFLATGDETHSTRGRARVLQEMVNGSLLADGFASDEVDEALDLCLSCKACRTDCPAGVDMAAYKSEVLHHRYRRRRRPIAHYVLGQLPRWTRLAGSGPRALTRALNGLLGVDSVRRAALRLGGMDRRRSIPRLAERPFRKSLAIGTASTHDGDELRPRVLLWADSFTDAFSPEAGSAVLRVLEAAGYEVLVPPRQACCGLTWITTGQLDGARRRLRSTLDVLGPFVEARIPIVGIEPSCIAALRQDLPELLPDDDCAAALGSSVRTLAEFLVEQRGRPVEDRWEPPSLAGVTAVVQPHCHQHAVLGFDADVSLLRGAGADVEVLAGCCGLAGNFGMERGHYELSVAVAERGLLPALRAASPGTVFLADGFSCRTQAHQLAGVDGIHLAELLARRLDATR